MKKEHMKAFSCIIELVTCPSTGRVAPKLTSVRPVRGWWLWLVSRLRRRTRPEDIPDSDIVFAVDAERSALVTLLQPWRKYDISDAGSAIRLSFAERREPKAKEHNLGI